MKQEVLPHRKQSLTSAARHHAYAIIALLDIAEAELKKSRGEEDLHRPEYSSTTTWEWIEQRFNHIT